MAFRVGRAYVELRADSERLKRDMKGARGDVSDATNEMQRSANRATSGFNKMWLAAAGAAVGFAVFRTMQKVIDLANKQEEAERKLEAVVRATGEAAGFTSDEMVKMAKSLQEVTSFGDETIIEMQAILATFKQIQGEAFERTTEVVLDMATVMNTDLRSAAIQVAKALNDPVANLGALGRAGVQFTKTQKEMIKTLWEAGDASKAQEIILRELESQFGGVSREVTDTFGGAMSQLKNVLGDAFEEIGYGITQNKDLIESIHGLRDSILDLMDRGELSKWADSTASALKRLANVTASLVGIMDSLYNISKQTSEIVFPESTLTHWDRYKQAVQNVLDVLRGVRDAQTGALKPTPENLALVGVGPERGPNALTVPERPEEAAAPSGPSEDLIKKRQKELESALQLEDEYATTRIDAQRKASFRALEIQEEIRQQERDKLIEHMEWQNEHNAEKIEQFNAYTDAEGELRDAAIWQAIEAERRKEDTLKKIRMEGAQNQLHILSTMFLTLSQLTQKNQKTLFNLYKAAAIAETTISTIMSAQKAYEWGWEYGGELAPIIAPAMAAIATAAGLARVAAIASQNIGSAGATGVASVGGGGAALVPGADVEGVSAGEERGRLNIIIEGDVLADEYYIERLAEKISEAVEDKEVRLISSGTRAV